jgi:PAS domain S-box-containing protein
MDSSAKIDAGLASYAARQAALFRLTDKLHRADTPTAIYDAALSALFDGLNCDRASILLYDDAKVMRFVAWRGLSDRYRKAVDGHSPWRPDEKAAAPICVADFSATDQPDVLKQTIAGEGIVALAFIPLVANGRLIGKFMTYYNKRHDFTADETDLALTIARQLAFSLSRLGAEEGRQRAEGARAHLAAIVESSDDAIVGKNLDGIIQSWNKGAERLFGYGAEEAIGKSVTLLIPPERLHEEPEIIGRIRKGERVDHYETVRRRKDGSLFDISLTVSPIKNADGEIIGASKIARDITERKRAEAQRTLLIDELNHRVKNTLATVISIARQSFANPNTDEARTSFDSRIRRLAQTHSRLSEASWSGVALATIVADELGPYRRDDGANLRIEGPSITLSPKSALMLGLAVHELATNAAKHGALSTKAGTVSVNWRLAGPDRRLQFDWVESGGPLVAAPGRSGFGRLLLERALVSDLKCDVELDFAPQGLHCAISLPLGEHAAVAK